jgi:molecular chaperone GrpE
MLLSVARQQTVAGLPQTRAAGVVPGMRWFSSNSSEDAAKSSAAEAKDAKDTEQKQGGEEKSEMDKVIDKLESELKHMQQEVAEMKSKALRAYADAENTRVIAKRDVDNAKAYAIQSFAKSLLDVADNLSRAIEAVPPEAKSKEENPQLVNLLEGVEMTSRQLQKVFGEYGITKVRRKLLEPHEKEFCFRAVEAVQFDAFCGRERAI